ncbi:MAG: acyl carrier protein [Clostridium sp.]|nr:acyl carrier protein [Clostridium sp.]
MNKENIEQVIKEYLLENFLFGYEENEISEKSSLLDMGILDSTGIMEIVSFLEQKFGIKVKDEDIIPSNLESLDAISNYVLERTE